MGGAREAAEVLLWLDPREETILRRVMRARVMAGQVREAEAAYWAFAERADPSGKWVPEARTRLLLQSVQDTSGRPGPEGPAPADHPFPFIGRATELATLAQSLYREHPGGRWLTAMVSGEPGIGKTRLVNEATRSARFRGCRVLTANPARLEREIALTSLIEVLSDDWALPFLRRMKEPWRSTALALLPEFRREDGNEGDAPPLVHAPTHERGLSHHACEALLHLFTAIAMDQKTIFVVDGLHWSDDASITVLQFLRRRWTRGDMTLLCTYCEDDLHPDHHVARFIREERQRPDALMLHLEGMAPEDGARLARAAMHPGGGDRPAPLSGAGASRVGATESGVEPDCAEVAEVAGGNPRYIIEVAARLREPASSRADGELHASGRGPALQAPDSVRQLVASRMDRVGEAATKVAFALAVVSRASRTSALRAVAGVSRAECLDALEQLRRNRLVKWTAEGVEFAHPLYGHAVYERIHPSRQTMLHGQAAEMLHRSVREPAPLELARHYHLAGKGRHASMCAVEAARLADPLPAAERMPVYKAAHKLSDGPRRAAIAGRLCRTSYQLRRLNDAIDYSAEALAHAKTAPHDALEIDLVVAEARHLAGHDDTRTALARLKELDARARSLSLDVQRAMILDARAQLLARTARRSELERLLKDARKLDPADSQVRCRTLATLATAPDQFDPRQPLAAANEAVALASDKGSPSLLALARERQAVAFAACGLLATPQGWKALGAARAAAAAASEHGRLVAIMAELVRWHALARNLRPAAGVAKELRELMRGMDCPYSRRLARLARCELEFAAGNLDAVKTLLEAERGSGREADRLTVSFGAVEGLLHLEGGKLNDVKRIARRCPIPDSLVHAPPNLILFHVRLALRTRVEVRSQQLLERSLEAVETLRPAMWIRLALEFVRVGRRTGRPNPQMAARARDRAIELGLNGLAHRLLSYSPP